MWGASGPPDASPGAGNTSGGIGGLLGGFGGIFSSVLGGIMGNRGAKKQNKWNMYMAAQDRKWKERMSNTAYQRAAKDLDAAGLNRIMALGSPASTPAGSMQRMENEGAAAVAAAASAAQISHINAQRNLLREQAQGVKWDNVPKRIKARAAILAESAADKTATTAKETARTFPLELEEAQDGGYYLDWQPTNAKQHDGDYLRRPNPEENLLENVAGFAKSYEKRYNRKPTRRELEAYAQDLKNRGYHERYRGINR